MAGARGSTNGSGADTRTARGAAESRHGAGGGLDRHGAAAAYGRAVRRTLTIGEAAARLSAEFPGVTAAVLRRLETAGKFTPARSSSGYRRYSEADLDLIRIVLSNQPAAHSPDPACPVPGSERAARSGGSDPADLSGAEHPLTHPAAGESVADDAFAAAGVARDRSAEGPLHGGRAGTQGSSAGRVSARAVRAASSSASRVPAARATVVVDDMQTPATRRTGVQRQSTEARFDVPVSGRIPRAGIGAPVAQDPVGFVEQPQRPGSAGAAAAAAANGSAGTAPGRSTPDGAPAPAAVSRRAERRWPDAEFFAPDLGEVALDRDQLAAAAHTDRAWVDGLVDYGLLSGNRSAGGADLLVARAAAELAQFGMEPRHLRAVAASAARVAELIASATATGAARDPARRERALLAAPGRGAEAAAAAVRLHAALVRAALLRG